MEVEANLAVNIMAPCWHRVQEMGGELGDGGSTWWYDGRGGWNSWGGQNGWDKGSVGVLSFRRASRDCIVPVSKQTLADIDGKETVEEHGGYLVGLG